MFGESLFETIQKKKTSGRWWTLSLSFLLHALIIFVLVVGPLMTAESNLPEVKTISALLVKPQLPTPPRGSSRASRLARQQKAKPKPTPSVMQRFVAPVEIPAQIQPPEDLLTIDTSGPEGTVGGIDQVGVPYGPIYEPEMNPSAPPIFSVRPPRLLKSVKPAYPELAIKTRTQGIVIIQAVTDIFGRVRETNVIAGHPLLNEAALEAVRKWVYEPYLVNGIPKSVVFTVQVTFTLQQEK